MKKVYLFVMASALTAGSVTSAPPGNPLPGKARENYDIRSDNEKAGTGALAAYRQKAAATSNTEEAQEAARQLLAAGRSEVLSRVAGLHVEDNLFGTAPEIVDIM